MCEQCLTNPIYFGQPLPGFTLARARRTGNDWQKGQWGLIQCNDPTFIWNQTPTPNPIFGMSEDEADAFEARLDLNADTKTRLEYSYITDEFRNAFMCSPDIGYELLTSAKEAGYTDGRFSDWLFDYLGNWLSKTDGTEDEDPFPHLEKTNPTDYTINKEILNATTN